VPVFKPAYLVFGDDHGRIAERRAKLRAVAEEESGVGGVEVLEGDACTADAVIGALTTMSFAMGRRFVIADGVERWKDADAEAVAAAMAGMDGETLTLALFGREESRYKVPEGLRKAVEAAGGQIAEEGAVKPWKLPGWLQARARELGLELDDAGAKALVAQVGDRQQRLLRELEKLALEHGEGATIGLDEVEAVASHSAERQVWALVDALMARDRKAATSVFLELRAQGEALARLVPLMAKRVREVLSFAERLEAGESPAQVKANVKMPPWMADMRMREARRSDVDTLRRALEALADLELASRGGEELEHDTVALRTIDLIATA
jgi:DNA polymerase-3 subunit delta